MSVSTYGFVRHIGKVNWAQSPMSTKNGLFPKTKGFFPDFSVRLKSNVDILQDKKI